jgi:putative transposase
LNATKQLSERISVSAACRALGVPRSSFYRARQAKQANKPRPTPPRALTPEEKEQVLQVLNDEPYQDDAPRQVYAALLDQGTYLCSWRTMYRILNERQLVRERRRQRQHPKYAKPELLATAPNQLWSWDITKLRGPAKWTYYYLYVLLDVYSRYVTGWMIATRESASLGQWLIEASCAKQQIRPGQLTLHADRGPVITVQDDEVPARLPRPLWFSTRCSCLGASVFPLVQPRALSYRLGFVDPGDCALWSRSDGPWPAPARPTDCLCRTS